MPDSGEMKGGTGKEQKQARMRQEGTVRNEKG